MSARKIKLVKKVLPTIVEEISIPETPVVAVAPSLPILKRPGTDATETPAPPPPNMRCIAICSDKKQCTRVKKRGCLLCGTHAKAMASSNTAEPVQKMKAVEVWVEDINGIAYYLDKNGNVYDTEDVLENRQNPRIIGRYMGSSPNISIEFI